MTKYRKHASGNANHVTLQGSDHRILPGNAGHPEKKMVLRISKKKMLVAILIVIVFAAGLWYFTMPTKDYTAFAQCISASGTKFYGAFWCPHCNDQKAMFGAAKGYLPYVECSTPDGQGQLDVCTNASVNGYPTWVFSDGTRLAGAQPLQTLADKTNCPLP